jgi:hypothetical protein
VARPLSLNVLIVLASESKWGDVRGRIAPKGRAAEIRGARKKREIDLRNLRRSIEKAAASDRFDTSITARDDATVTSNQV